MSQHDMDIANASRTTVRADINAALVALASLSSGATEPATKFAYQWWADTTTGIGKVRNAANTAWIDAYDLATGKVIAAVTATNTGGKTTIASATTPDIFATTVGTIVDYTGTATCTGFAAAPQAGATKRLTCAGACLFTAGANLLIEGIPSGTTITLAANALVDVTAITTTQFKMTYSVSGTFTGTATGLTTSPTATVKYRVENGVAHMSIPAGALVGTSNSTSFTMTGLPSCLVPATIKTMGNTNGYDNSAYVASFGANIGASGTALRFSVGGNNDGFTASGTKALYATEFIYMLN